MPEGARAALLTWQARCSSAVHFRDGPVLMVVFARMSDASIHSWCRSAIACGTSAVRFAPSKFRSKVPWDKAFDHTMSELLATSWRNERCEIQFANGPRAVRGCVDGDPWRDVRTRASPNGCSHESLRPSPVNGSARTMGWPVRPRVPGMLPPSVRCRSPSMPSRGGGVAGRFRPGACGETTARPCTPRGAMLGFLFVHLGLTFVHGLFSCGRTTVHCRPLGFRCHP